MIKITSDTPRTARLYGGLCFTGRGGDVTSNATTKVWTSLFNVRKMTDGKGGIKQQESDVNEAKAFEIVAADKAGSGRNSHQFANASKPVCVYTKGVNVNDGQPTTPSNADNPLLFRMDINLDMLEQKITSAKVPPTDGVRQRVFDTEDCSIYVHLDSNTSSDPKDTYNIFRIPLEDFVDQATKDRLCPLPTPTPTEVLTVTPSITPSITPSVTPSITPVPVTYKCFEPENLNDKGCRTTSQCERTNEAGEALECFQVSLRGSSSLPITPDPRNPQPDSSDSESDHSTDSLNVPTAVGACEDGETCRCLPKRCLNGDCTTYPKACMNISPTPTSTPPPPVACEYKAVAFIEECTQLDSNGRCVTDPNQPERFMAKPIDSSVLNTQWAPLNEKMRDNSTKQDHYFTNRGATKNAEGDEVLTGTDDIRFHAMGSDVTERASLEGLFRFFKKNNSLKNDLTYSLFTDSQQLKSGSNPLTADAEIQHGLQNDKLRYPEVYKNHKTNAEVKFYFDKKQYRVVPGGNKIYSCVNDYKNVSNGTAACSNPDSQPIDQINRDKVRGLTVGCGQEIVYGVTLQKCDFNYDYIFIVDTSNSMTTPENDDRNAPGPDKLTAASEQLAQFVKDINVVGPDSRVAVGYFNTGVGFDMTNGSQILTNFTPISDQAKLLNSVSYNSLKAVGHEGTCVACGLQTAKKLVEGRGTDNKRRPVVILLSDGNINQFPGTQQDIAAQTAATYGIADDLQKTNNGNITVVTIGYGNAGGGASDRVNFKDMIERIASFRKDKVTKWAYATDPEIATSGEGGTINEIVSKVQENLNSCAVADLAYQEFIKASDINKDGVINSLDLLMLYDNYAKRGESIPEDVNKDRVVNALDASLVIQNYGKLIETASASTGGLTNPAELDTTPAN